MEVAKKLKSKNVKKLNPEQVDKRDLINDLIIDEGRKLTWLAERTGINKQTLFSILRYKTVALSDENLQKINKALGTTF